MRLIVGRRSRPVQMGTPDAYPFDTQIEFESCGGSASKSRHTEARKLGVAKSAETARTVEGVAQKVGVSKQTMCARKAKDGCVGVSEKHLDLRVHSPGRCASSKGPARSAQAGDGCLAIRNCAIRSTRGWFGRGSRGDLPMHGVLLPVSEVLVC
jgi:hypothetical protein